MSAYSPSKGNVMFRTPGGSSPNEGIRRPGGMEEKKASLRPHGAVRKIEEEKGIFPVQK